MSKENPISQRSQAAQFAALVYSSNDMLAPSDDIAKVILILVLDPVGPVLEARARSDWESVVSDLNREYVASVLTDLKQRAKFDPIQLFEQVCNLSVGPIVTLAFGSEIQSQPELASQYRHFVTL
jgi:hypothetical protein